MNSEEEMIKEKTQPKNEIPEKIKITDKHPILTQFVSAILYILMMIGLTITCSVIDIGYSYVFNAPRINFNDIFRISVYSICLIIFLSQINLNIGVQKEITKKEE